MKTFLFASDLDRTLIYSSRFLTVDEGASLMNLPEESPYELIEVKEQQPISFMTQKARVLLQTVAEKGYFVPVTTRTVAQYQRIQLFQTKITPTYAVASNGGQILYHNKPDAAWFQLIKKSVQHESMKDEDFMKAFEQVAHSSWLQSVKQADALFYTCQVDPEAMPEDEIADFARWSSSVGWQLSAQGRKLYLVPSAVNKGVAIKEVCQRMGIIDMVAAGDSLLDLPLLEAAGRGYAPAHGEIMRQLKQQDSRHRHIEIVNEMGITAAEVILEEVHKIFMQTQ